MKQPEAKFKDELVKAYTEVFPKGWYQYNRSTVRIGTPDLYFALPHSVHAIPLWIEAKVNTPVTAIQEVQLRRLVASGQKAVILRARKMDKKKPERHIVASPLDGRTAVFGWAELHSITFWDWISQ